MTITLRPMTRQEYERRRPALVAEYAQDEIMAGRVRPGAALDRARKQLDDMVPDGPDTADTLMFTAEAGTEDGPTTVGWLWIGLPTAVRPQAWVFEVFVDEAYRGKGYGRALMLAAEEELRGRGIDQLGLNVFGYNTVAIRLYESLGYQVMSQTMAKRIRSE